MTTTTQKTRVNKMDLALCNYRITYFINQHGNCQHCQHEARVIEKVPLLHSIVVEVLTTHQGAKENKIEVFIPPGLFEGSPRAGCIFKMGSSNRLSPSSDINVLLSLFWHSYYPKVFTHFINPWTSFNICQQSL